MTAETLHHARPVAEPETLPGALQEAEPRDRTNFVAAYVKELDQTIIPRSPEEADQVVAEVRTRSTAVRKNIEAGKVKVDQEVADSLQGIAEAGTDHWLLNQSQRKDWESFVRARAPRYLSARAKTYLDPEDRAGSFTKLKEEAKARLSLDESLAARELAAHVTKLETSMRNAGFDVGHEKHQTEPVMVTPGVTEVDATVEPTQTEAVASVETKEPIEDPYEEYLAIVREQLNASKERVEASVSRHDTATELLRGLQAEIAVPAAPHAPSESEKPAKVAYEAHMAGLREQLDASMERMREHARRWGYQAETTNRNEADLQAAKEAVTAAEKTQEDVPRQLGRHALAYSLEADYEKLKEAEQNPNRAGKRSRFARRTAEMDDETRNMFFANFNEASARAQESKNETRTSKLLKKTGEKLTTTAATREQEYIQEKQDLEEEIKDIQAREPIVSLEPGELRKRAGRIVRRGGRLAGKTAILPLKGAKAFVENKTVIRSSRIIRRASIAAGMVAAVYLGANEGLEDAHEQLDKPKHHQIFDRVEIQPGDTISDLERERHPRMSEERLKKLIEWDLRKNGLTPEEAKNIQPGDVIKLRHIG